METKRIKILAVDDNPDNLVVLKALLSKTFPEAKYIQSLSGKKAIELCLEENPDVILLDIVMLVNDGYEVCRRIKSNDSISYIPVVMITASRGDTQSRIKALECGADAFLAKPIDESELTAQIRTMVLIKEAEERRRDEKVRLQELVDEQTKELVEELKQRRKAEEELQQSLDKLEKSRQAELNLLEDLRAKITERKQTERALSESEERFRTLYEDSPIGIYRTTPDGQILLANPSLIKMLGYKSFNELKHRDLKNDGNYEPGYNRTQFKEKIEREGKINGLETVWKHKGGSLVYIRESSVLVRDNFGNPLYYDGTVEDITERKLAESALKASEDKFRSLFENMVEGFAYCKMLYENGQPHDFIYLDVNQSFESLTRLQNVAGRKVSEVIPGIRQSDPVLFETYSRVALSGKTERFEIYLESLKMWFHISVYSPVKEYFVAVFDVINDRKIAEGALKESEEKYRRMVDVSPDAVLIHADGKIVFANPATLLLMKADSFDQIIDIPVINFVHPEFKAIALERIKNIYQTGEATNFTEEKFMTLKNEIIDVEVIGIPVNYMGKPAIQTIARDITSRKETENALKESHDFNSSLLKTLPFGMQIVDETGTILFIDEKLIKESTLLEGGLELPL